LYPEYLLINFESNLKPITMNLSKLNFSQPASVCLVFLLMIAASCTVIYFDQPQPVDARNLRKVPKSLRGQWVKVSESDSSFIQIDKKNYSSREVSYYRIPLRSIESSAKYKLLDGKIFNLEEDAQRGYPYRLSNDTVFFSEWSEGIITLSDSALLRKGRGCYLLNLKTELGWEIFMLRKGTGGKIYMDYPLKSDLYNLLHRYPVSVLDSTREDTIVFRARLKSRDIPVLFNSEGGGTIWELRPDGTFTDEN
jgi:hypothetical protein